MAEKDKKIGEQPLSEEQQLIKKLQNENTVLAEYLKELLRKIKGLEYKVSLYENIDEYKKCKTWIEKAVFIIKHENKPLRSSELITLLSAREPTLKHKQESTEKYVSAFLNKAMKYKRLVPYKVKGVRGYYYCLPEWVNEKGELLKEFKDRI